MAALGAAQLHKLVRTHRSIVTGSLVGNDGTLVSIHIVAMATHRKRALTRENGIVRSAKAKLSPERVEQNALFLAWLDDCVRAEDPSYDWAPQARTWTRAVRRAAKAAGVELPVVPHAFDPKGGVSTPQNL